MAKGSNDQLAILREELSAELKELEADPVLKHPVFKALSLRRLRRNHQYTSYPSLRTAYTSHIHVRARISEIQATLIFIDEVLEERREPLRIHTESGVAEGFMSSGVAEESERAVAQNLTDVMGEADVTKVGGNTVNSRSGQENILKMGEFLSRPVQLLSTTLTLSTAYKSVLRVWDLYTLDPSVRAKLRNFAYLRGDLHLRIAISGTPFHFGKVLLSYQPYDLLNQTLVSYETNLGPGNTLLPCLNNYLSQSRGSVVLDVRDNQPVEIVCPFLSAKPMHRLFNHTTTALGDSTSYDDLDEAGALYITTLNNIEAAVVGATDVSIFVYAWMENVELGAPTATQIAITTESGKMEAVAKGKQSGKKDERETGPVQRFASGAASIARTLSSIPMIAPYAKASEIVLNGVASVSSIFGWSKPVLVDDVKLVKNVPFSNSALTIGNDTNFRIVLDPKQETTVDPRIAGSDEDEMVINYITSIESYLTTFTWSSSDATMSSPIYSLLVTPNISTKRNLSAIDYYQPTALAFASIPFRYWRGTIKYRLEVVCSAYHRGKFAIYYEPNISQAVLINADVATNKQFLKIVDIQQTQSIEFCVEWAFMRDWAKVYAVDESGITINNTTRRAANGYIAIVPLNALQSPDDSDISINVYISSDDIKFNYLDHTNFPTYRTVYTESGEMVSEEKTHDMQDISCIPLNESSADPSHISEEFFGEQPVSFRSLLKRYAYYYIETLGADANDYKVITSTQPVWPDIYPDYGNNQTESYRNLFSYLRYAYVGMRGGLRYRTYIWTDGGMPPHATARVTLDPISDGPTYAVTTSTISAKSFINGTAVFIPNTNGGIEVEVPYYNNNLFLFSFADGKESGSYGFDTVYLQSYQVQVMVTGATVAGYVTADIAAAEDFNFLRFQGAPYYTGG